MKYTGISMGGGIINTKNIRALPCDCGKCYHKRRNFKERYNYCSYYEIPFPTNKNRCVRYYGPPVVTSIRQNSKDLKSCKNCIYFISEGRRCNKFNFDITTYGLGSKCKGFNKFKKTKSK